MKGFTLFFAGQSRDCVNLFASESLVSLNLLIGESLQDSPAKNLKETKFTREKIDAMLRLTRVVYKTEYDVTRRGRTLQQKFKNKQRFIPDPYTGI